MAMIGEGGTKGSEVACICWVRSSVYSFSAAFSPNLVIDPEDRNDPPLLVECLSVGHLPLRSPKEVYMSP